MTRAGAELAGQVAVVTGAAIGIGIGWAIAAELGAAGAKVVVADVRSAEDAAPHFLLLSDQSARAAWRASLLATGTPG